MRAKQLNTDRLAWRWYANRSVLFLFLRHMYLPLWHFLHSQRLFPSKSTLFQNQRKGGAKMTVFRIKKQEITRLCPTIICGICRRHWKRRFFIPHTIPAGELGLYHERSCTYLRGRHWQHQQQCPRSGDAWLPYRHKEQREQFRNFFITKRE